MQVFFHLWECGAETRDEEGRDLPDLAAARLAAIDAAREVMCEELSHGRLCLACHIDVVDEHGTVMLKLPFRDAVVITC